MGYLTWILGLVGAIVLGLLKEEVSAWLPKLAHWCVLRAADRTTDRERWREEWLAHLDECPGKLGQLSHALSVLTSAWGRDRLRRWRLWFEILRYLPSFRWSAISVICTIIFIILAPFNFYQHYVSDSFPSASFSALAMLYMASAWADRRFAATHPRDLALIQYVKDLHRSKSLS